MSNCNDEGGMPLLATKIDLKEIETKCRTRTSMFRINIYLRGRKAS